MEQLLNYWLEFPFKNQPAFVVNGGMIAQESGVYEFHFPAWRPGRYERGDFLKRVAQLQWKKRGVALNMDRCSNGGYAIKLDAGEHLTWSYEIHTNSLDAGSSYVQNALIYINPIQTFFFLSNRSAEYQLEWEGDVPYYGQIEPNGNCIHLKDEQELFDSPFFLSEPSESLITKVEGTPIGVHFFGAKKAIDLLQVENDIVKMARTQFGKMGGYPHQRYDFYIVVVPKVAYHGVEHSRSTVVLLGPDGEIDGKRYPEFLGVCSHELFHVWNAKGIRPEGLVPYNFKEVPSNPYLFFIEGITSYLGDYYLWSSGVFSDDDYLKELNTTLRRFQYNFGRKHTSLQEGSENYWADGYGGGAEHRSISIYVDGAIWALCLDLELRKVTGGKIGVDTLVANVYARKGKEQNRNLDVGFAWEDWVLEVGAVLPKEKTDLFCQHWIQNPWNGLRELELYLPDFGLEMPPLKTGTWHFAGVEIQAGQVRATHPSSGIYGMGVRRGDRLELKMNKSKQAFVASGEKALTGEPFEFVLPMENFTLQQLQWKKSESMRAEWRAGSQTK